MHHTKLLAPVKRFVRNTPTLFWMVGVARYIQFRHALAAAERRHTPGSLSPPPLLRYRVHRALDEGSYIAVGKAVAADLAQALEQHVLEKHPIYSANANVLDLGCGPGRVARWFKERFPDCNLHASDIDQEAIHWAQQNLSFVGDFTTNASEPPTSYPAAKFDLAYCISLFTHLDAPMQDQWLQELRRIIRPGGYLIATTHGRFATQTCTDEERRRIGENGIEFRTDHKGGLKLDGLPDFYQTTFHSKPYIARHWSKFFDIVAHIEGGLGGHQDLVLMRRP